MDNRADRQDAMELAHSTVLRYLIVALLPDDSARIAIREKLCSVIERLYEDQTVKLAEHAHPPIQRAIAEIEELFAPGG